MGRKEDLEKFDLDWDYTTDTEVDVDNLDIEAASQSGRFMKYALLAAQATKEYQEAWEEVKTTRSELILEFRDDNPKAKNDEVEAYYRTHDDYKLAKKAMIKAEFVKNILDGAVMAMHQKKAGIEHAVKLHGQGYYADPSADGAREVAKDRKSARARGAVRDSLNSGRSTSGRKKRSGRKT